MDSKLISDIKTLSLELKGKNANDIKMLIGVDGFVDEIIHVVDKRHDFENYSRVETIADFGAKISNAAGLSMNFEFVPQIVKLGGNGPILTNALLMFGFDVSYIGAIGNNSVHQVFKEMADKCSVVYPISEPGHTDAVEFIDGKLMLGKHSALKDVTWDSVKRSMGGPKEMARKIEDCFLIGMENWVMIPYMSQIWEGMIEEIFPLLSDKKEKPYFFFDLCDPEKRTKEDIFHAMKLIREFGAKFRTCLGLNEKELFEIAEVMGVTVKADADKDELIKKTTVEMFEKLGVDCLVIHTVKAAHVFSSGEYAKVDGPYCETPKLTTGAGDNFNAGFCLGLGIGLKPADCILTGVATSGYYVRNAGSPTYQNLIEFLEKWSLGLLDE